MGDLFPTKALHPRQGLVNYLLSTCYGETEQYTVPKFAGGGILLHKKQNGKQDILMWQGGLKLPGLTIAWAELLKIHCRYLGKKEGGHATVGEDMASAERCQEGC